MVHHKISLDQRIYLFIIFYKIIKSCTPDTPVAANLDKNMFPFLLSYLPGINNNKLLWFNSAFSHKLSSNLMSYRITLSMKLIITVSIAILIMGSSAFCQKITGKLKFSQGQVIEITMNVKTKIAQEA